MISGQSGKSVIRIRARQPDRGFPSTFPAQSGCRAVQNLRMDGAFFHGAGAVTYQFCDALCVTGPPYYCLSCSDQNREFMQW